MNMEKYGFRLGIKIYKCIIALYNFVFVTNMKNSLNERYIIHFIWEQYTSEKNN